MIIELTKEEQSLLYWMLTSEVSRIWDDPIVSIPETNAKVAIIKSIKDKLLPIV